MDVLKEGEKIADAAKKTAIDLVRESKGTVKRTVKEGKKTIRKTLKKVR